MQRITDIVIFSNKLTIMNRKEFIRNSSLTAAGIAILNFPIFSKKAPSNKVMLEVMGVDSRGVYLAVCFSKL